MLDTDVQIPTELRHRRFVATPLTAAIAELDYASYLASPEVIAVHSDGRWPTAGFTLADNAALVQRHYAEHVARRAFTFALLAPSRTESFGCVYVRPLRDYLRRVHAEPHLVGSFPSTTALVTFWLRHDQQDTGLVEAVAEAVHDWLEADWPFAMHLFRVLPDERSSRAALDQLGLTKTVLTLPHEERPYIWYHSGPPRAGRQSH